MSEKNTSDVFKFIESLVANAGLEAVQRQPADAALEIRNFIEQHVSKVFDLLANEVESQLGHRAGRPEWKPAWAQWSTEYSIRKMGAMKRNPLAQGMAYHRGQTAGAIRALSSRTDQLFGKAQVSYSVDIGGVTYNYSVDRRGRTRYAKGSRDTSGKGIGGRFVSHTIAQVVNAKFQIRMSPTPLEVNRSWIESNVSLQAAAFEYGAKRRSGAQPARPLIVPYLEWYMGTHFRNELKNKLSLSL